MEGAGHGDVAADDRWMATRAARFCEPDWALDEYLADPPRFVPTHISGLDEWMPGGLRAGVNLVMAEPGAGKSALGCHLAYSAAMDGLRAAFVSMEMPADQCWVRMAAEHAARSGGRLTAFSWGDDDRWRRETHRRVASGEMTPEQAAAADPLLRAANALWRDAPGLVVSDVRGATDAGAVCAEVASLTGAGCSLIVVDYLQRMTAPGSSRYESLTAATHALTDTLRDAGAVGVVISSMGREARRGGDAMGGADGTGAIEYDAESVWRLSRDEEATVPGHPEARVIAVSVVKSRHGRVTTKDSPILVRWQPDTNVFW